MSLYSTIKLVKSLSGSEKRYFKLYVKRQKVSRYYLYLYHMIDKSNSPDVTSISMQFKKKYPAASLYNCARYLGTAISDCLIDLKSEHDTLFSLLKDFKRVKIFEERSLKEDAIKTIYKIRDKAANSQHPFVEYLSYREELNLLKGDGFSGISSDELIEKQMKARELLKIVFAVHEHYSLFEILEQRVISSGKVSSREEEKNLNDLIISEIGIVNPHLKNNFASMRLRLNFQSYFFTNIGDYQSALKTFTSLNRLFESNHDLLDFPPTDYLLALNGILDSLHMLGQFRQMPYYIDKLRDLDDQSYPDYFRNRLSKTIALYHLILFISKEQFADACTYIETINNSWLTSYNKIDEEKQWELYFYFAKTFFELKLFKKAHRWIGKCIREQTSNKAWLVCKATGLLNAIIYYELGEREYLDYVVKAYTREFGRSKVFKCESLLLKFLKEKSKRRPLRQSVISQLNQYFEELKSNPYENQFLKYFDFEKWLRKNMGKFP